MITLQDIKEKVAGMARLCFDEKHEVTPRLKDEARDLARLWNDPQFSRYRENIGKLAFDVDAKNPSRSTPHIRVYMQFVSSYLEVQAKSFCLTPTSKSDLFCSLGGLLTFLELLELHCQEFDEIYRRN